MNRVRSYFRLTGDRRRLVRQALAIVAAVRLGLTVLGFARLRRLLERLKTSEAAPKGFEPEELAWGVSAASGSVPGASCLTQALALQVLMARHGHPSTLRIGVEKDGPRLKAHAWVESNGKILIGEHGSSQFVPLSGAPGAPGLFR